MTTKEQTEEALAKLAVFDDDSDEDSDGRMRHWWWKNKEETEKALAVVRSRLAELEVRIVAWDTIPGETKRTLVAKLKRVMREPHSDGMLEDVAREIVEMTIRKGESTTSEEHER